MIGFVLIVLQISTVLGKTICDNHTEYSRDAINLLLSYLYGNTTVPTQNFMMSSIAGLDLVLNRTQKHLQCSPLLLNVHLDFNNDNPDVIEFKDTMSFNYKGPKDGMKNYDLHREMYLRSRLDGLKNPQLRLLPFTSQNKISKKVLTMCFKVKSSNHFYVDDSQILILPIGKSKFKMTIFLPGKNISVEQAEQKFKDHGHTLPNMNKEEVIYVKLPIFKIQTEINLVSLLNKLGFSDVFTHPYYIQKYYTFGRLNEVIQKTFVEIHGMTPKSGNVPEDELTPANYFFADRAFLVEISYDDVIFFKGRVVNL